MYVCMGSLDPNECNLTAVADNGNDDVLKEKRLLQRTRTGSTFRTQRAHNFSPASSILSPAPLPPSLVSNEAYVPIGVDMEGERKAGTSEHSFTTPHQPPFLGHLLVAVLVPGSSSHRAQSAVSQAPQSCIPSRSTNHVYRPFRFLGSGYHRNIREQPDQC